MSILASFMVPHPPLIIPEVGKGGEKQIEITTQAYRKVAEDIAALSPDTIIISSPHSVMYSDYFHISPGKEATGSFTQFRAPQVKFREQYDTELGNEICRLADERHFPAGTMGERDRYLDHGTMVPLYFIRQKYQECRDSHSEFKIIRIGLSGLALSKHYELGQIIQEAVKHTGRRVVYVASGDLSHKLQAYGPYGFAPEGPQYDERIMRVMGAADFGELLQFDETFCEKAAECGHRSFVIMAGALDGIDVEARELSHEDVTGVGYGICEFFPKNAGRPDSPDSRNEERCFLKSWLERKAEECEKQREKEDPYVSLARKSLEKYILTRKEIDIPDALPEEMMKDRAGVFVSIHEHGRLRGCIGTIQPVTGCIAREIIRNAISASTQDPRFDPIEPDELQWLEINVDVLGAPEKIDSMDKLDVKRYGVIVTKGRKRGLLLPDLDGVDTVEQQVSIAKRKAGISPKETVELERFEVIRHT